jgi:hypothetical protein
MARLSNTAEDTLDGGALNQMPWQEFETLVGEYFHRRGYTVVETGDGVADDGVDLVVEREGRHYLVQCKQVRELRIDVKVLRELYGVTAARRAKGCFVVTSGYFTDEAKRFAAPLKMGLIDGERLARAIAARPKREFEQPKREFAQPKSEFAHPTSEFAQPKSEFAQPRSEFAQPRSEFAQPRSEFDLQPSGRREPRFDEQWAANAAELPRARSIDFGPPDQLDALATRRVLQEDSRRRVKRARRGWFTVIAGGISVGGLLLYLFVTLSGIGPPKEFGRQADGRTNGAPVAGRELAAAAQAKIIGENEQADRKGAAWQRFYQPSETCRADPNRGSIACVNEYMRAKVEFEKRWFAGQL